MQTASAKFDVIEIVPLYEYSRNMGDRKKVAVGVEKAAVVCNLCGSRWIAIEGEKADEERFSNYGQGIELMCGACQESDTIALRPMLAQTKGQQTVSLNG